MSIDNLSAARERRRRRPPVSVSAVEAESLQKKRGESADEGRRTKDGGRRNR
ncbi:MAG TPA: hypothetical protein VFJ58_24930 [Armatimonadota bacterium]|nr:hypothetical protein [Armatimonadota bacterium]